MKVIENIPSTLQRCDNCGRSPKFLACFTRIQRPIDTTVLVCADCLSDGERGVRDRAREDYGKQT